MFKLLAGPIDLILQSIFDLLYEFLGRFMGAA